jgi:predicted helicase
MLSFQQMLISDIDNKSFSDLYSQTIAYGMFAARYHDPSLENFSREEAVKLIPKSNPFLRKLFKDIADEDLDIRLNWIIDELVNIFLASDVLSIMKDFGKSTKQEDPVVHFYETFLGAYNPALRKARGVWYTPQPVVNFIVRAVDDILKSEFDLPEGLADSSKKKIKVNIQGRQIEKEVHKVQILDPATGTGTFLAETIKHIHSKYVGMQGIWSKYVEDDLIPRINGFELLMASYAMAHLKLDMLLTETGYVPTRDQRLRVFLTNSLEEAHPDSGTLWGNLLSEEADQANEVKRDTPVMCVIGNPPYSGISSNNGKWISDLIDDYKYVDGVHFNEKKHWLNDDYVKFLRHGQHFIEKNGQGVLAFINPHGFLDNPTFRGMRWNLLKTYDKIYTIDLHGNSKKKEKAPDGSADVNVFDIMQGVSINVFVKTGKKKSNELGKVCHFDLYGKREMKYHFLAENSLKSIDFVAVNYSEPYFFYNPKNESGRKNYEEGFKINDIFRLNNTGIVTGIDRLAIFMSSEDLNETISEIINSEYPFDKFKIEDSRRTTKEGRIKELKTAYQKGPVKINYRPFDIRYTLPFTQNEHWINSPRTDVMQHFLLGENVGLICPKQVPDKEESGAFITKYISGHKTSSAYNINNIFPLYLYANTMGQKSIVQSELRIPNLDIVIVKQIADKLGLAFTNEKEISKDTFAPMDILDYIYGVLHSPSYRENYKEFLKIDFPRVPYPKNREIFWKLGELGGAIRQLHLLESSVLEKPISKYPMTGTNIVAKPKYENGNVYINDTQYFEDVPEVAWNFYIGGYQPAQKWLKDRKDRELQIDDIRHYMKIVVALSETDRLMKEIDKITIL